MLKEYQYRKHIRWGQYLWPIFFGMILTAFWGIMIQRNIPLQELYNYFGMSVGILLAAAGVWYIFYWFGGIVISLSDEGLISKNRLKVTQIPLTAIKALRFSNIPYTGGWVKIVAKEKNLMLTVVVKNIGDFLKQLKEVLDRQGLSDVYDKKNYFSFYKTAEYADQSWERLYDHALRIIVYSLSAILFSVAFIIFLDLTGMVILIGGILVVSYAPLVYIISEIKFLKDLIRKSDEESFYCPGRDVEFEKKLYREAVIKGIIVYFGAIAGLLILQLAKI